jgi:YD repeat-containing protein
MGCQGFTFAFCPLPFDLLLRLCRLASMVRADPFIPTRMVNITDAANHNTGFTYDALGRVTQVTFPSTLSESYTYDAMNNLGNRGQAVSIGRAILSNVGIIPLH